MFIPELTTRVTVNTDTTELDDAISLMSSYGLDEVASELQERKDKLLSLEEPLADAVAKEMSSIQENIISSKHYKTGMMSNGVDVSADGKDRLVGNTASSATGFPYPLAIEKGTRDHWVAPVTFDALHWTEGGKDYFSKGHMVSGITPDPFVQPSIDDTMYMIESIFNDL
jgi:hypothetical protein